MIRRVLEAAGTAVVAISLALCALGLALQPVLSPGFTRLLVTRLDVADEADLSSSRTLELAEDVRAFVADPEAPELPETVDGRDGFDALAVSHLEDVRAVISGARLATGLTAGLLTAWLVAAIVRRTYAGVVRGLRAGAALIFAVFGAAVLAAFLDFGTLFAGFHALFFAEGTWTFPQGTLLIQLFPEAFWATAGAAWGAVTLLVALGYLLAAYGVRRQAVGRTSGASGPIGT